MLDTKCSFALHDCTDFKDVLSGVTLRCSSTTLPRATQCWRRRTKHKRYLRTCALNTGKYYSHLAKHLVTNPLHLVLTRLLLHQTRPKVLLLIITDSSLCTFSFSFRSVKGRGQALQFECARLVTEKKRLLEFAEVLNRKLGYFDELELITRKFHAARSQVRA